MSHDREQPGVALSDGARRAIAYLRSPAAIRERAEAVFAAGLAGKLTHFAIELNRLEVAADRVVAVTRAAYPDLAIPYHSRLSHFRAGGVDRLARLASHLGALDARERGRCLYDLVVTSVLLDAGAGTAWCYRERDTGLELGRSEGLAVATFDMFTSGAFSSDPDQPLQADAGGLARIDTATLASHFQATDDNPLVGVSGRAGLLQRLSESLRAHPEMFTSGHTATPRVGHLFDYLCDRAVDGALSAPDLLGAVLDGLGNIWPGRITIGPFNLGDVWHHDAAGGSGLSARLVPFHKLSQWLAYSLIEPLEAAGVQVVDLDQLTGLSEYRNGGLFMDTGVLVPRHEEVTAGAHRPSSEVVVEWRALTLALLDRVAVLVRERLGMDAAELPLVKILEGGTWSAGRQIARELRADGSPPIRIESDGTVF